MRVEVGPGARVRHHECTESRCGNWHGRSHSGAENILWYTSLNTVKEGESYPKCEKTWPYSGSSISETKGRKFQEEEGRKRGKSGECFDCICFQFNLSVVDSGSRPPFYSKCNESSFQRKLAFFFLVCI